MNDKQKESRVPDYMNKVAEKLARAAEKALDARSEAEKDPELACKIFDRLVALEKLKHHLKDEEYGSGFIEDTEKEETE